MQCRCSSYNESQIKETCLHITGYCITDRMAITTLLFSMLVMAFSVGVFMAAMRSAFQIRAFRGSFIWTFGY